MAPIQSKIKKIAIIGSGIAGSSTAFNLKRNHGTNVEVSMFEKENVVGGRMQVEISLLPFFYF